MEERWRLFVAIEIGEEARQAVQAAQRAAQRVGFSVRWGNPANAHLTLKFLGDTNRKRVVSLGAALDEAVASRPAFMVQTEQIGGFPSLHRPRVLWLGLGGALGQLATLQQAVESAMVQQGFPIETRAFSPHLTLGRLRRDTALPTPASVALLAVSADFVGVALPVQRVQLVRSELVRNGARYTALHTVPLTGARG